MNFLFPTFLIGLTAIAIPIIIHLFNFRKYKKVYFTNVQFLKELKQESDSKSRLKEWLILLMRILAITCLVFAFAQPFIPGKSKNTQGEKAVSVYVDNSFTMENLNKKGTLLENAKSFAAEIVKSFNTSDKFQLITNDFEGKHQRFLSKEEFIEQLEEVKISSATRQLNDVIKRQQDFLHNANSKNKRLFLISDFQKNASTFNKPDIDTSIAITCIPVVSEEINNVFIDSVWFENPVQQYGTSQTLHAYIFNKSSKDIENGSLKLYINGKQVSISSFNIGQGEKKEVSISFTVKEKGINNGTLKIEDYPIVFDDEFYFSFNAEISIPTLIINGKDSRTAGNFRSLMKDDNLFVYNENNESAIDYGLFPKVNFIILNELTTISSGLTSELQKFINGGGSVVIFPNNKADLVGYNLAFQVLQLPILLPFDTTNTKTQLINFEQGLYAGVFEKVDQRMDMPKVYEHYPIKQVTTSTTQNIISLQNGQSFLSAHKLGSGKIYLFSVPSDESASNFVKHALFVPSIIKMAILSLKPTPIYYRTSVNEAISVSLENNFSDKPLHMIKSDKSIDVIPEHRMINNTTTLFTQNQINQAGHYTINQDLDIIKGIAFDFDRKESDMSFFSIDELQKQIDEKGIKNMNVVETNEKTIGVSIHEVNDGKKLWKLFLILALIFLLAEILIIRLFKS